MYCIEVMGFGVNVSTETAAIELKDISGGPALSWENATVNIRFHLHGFNLRMILGRPHDDKPSVFINKSPALEDGLHQLYAGDRILIPGMEVMMVVFSSDWRKMLQKRQRR